MALMTKMANRELIQHFMTANTKPGEMQHKFTTIGNIPKHTKEMMLKNKVLTKAMHNLHGNTYMHPATEATKELMKEGYLHHAKTKHGTATGFVHHIFTQEEQKMKIRSEQNIRDTKADRAKDEAKNSALNGRDAINRVSTITGNAVSATPNITMSGSGTSKTHMLLHENDTSVRKGSHTDALSLLGDDNGAIETNLKPLNQLPQLPQAIAKPDDWIKADAEIEDEAID